MENFLNQIKREEPGIYNKLSLLYELTDELYNQSPDSVTEFIGYLQKKYGISEPEQEGVKINLVENEAQTEDGEELPICNWDTNDIAKDVASVAKRNLEENGFVYDEISGLYYDHKLQCYYNPQYKLYYYHQTGAYYYYDEEIKGLKYYCAASETGSPGVKTTEAIETKEAQTIASQEESSSENAKEDSKMLGKEEGECSDSDDDVPSGPVVIEAGPKSFEPDHSKHVAPYIRVLVKSSEISDICPGTLFMVTCTGGTLGREGKHDVLIPDQLVSVLHSSFRYSYKDGSYFYEVMDMGSKNGTFLNGQRLSDTLVQSDPFELKHGSIIRVGRTDLLCHIHDVYETCEECDAHSALQEKKQEPTSDLTLRQKYCKEALAIRKKFGITSNNVLPKYPQEYEDRSEARRKTVGSSHPSEKTEASCVHKSIDKRNKGFALLSKMGWVEGTSLGKSGDNILDPINPESNEGKHGLGFEESPSAPVAPSKAIRKKRAVNKITIERFKELN